MACGCPAPHLACCCLLMGARVRCCTAAVSLVLPASHCFALPCRLHLEWLSSWRSMGAAALRTTLAGRTPWHSSSAADERLVMLRVLMLS